MSQLPDRYEQIRLVHAEFIRLVVETCRNPGRKRDLETLLDSAAKNGWTGLVGAIRRIAAGERGQTTFADIRPLIDGERDANRLCQGMDAQGERLVLSILEELGRLEAH